MARAAVRARHIQEAEILREFLIVHIKFVVILIGVLAIGAGQLAVYSKEPIQDDLSYRLRGNRYEGLQDRSVSGYDIELISARSSYDEPFLDFPDIARIRYFLETPKETYITVRELEPSCHYRLEASMSEAGSRARAYHIFEWSTRDVLRKLTLLDGAKSAVNRINNVYELGVVVRIGQKSPSFDELVAPATYYSSKLPFSNTGYIFTVRTSQPARLACVLIKEGRTQALGRFNFPRVWGGEPVSAVVNMANHPDGKYRLEWDGYFRNSNDKIQQTVRFYHKRNMND